MCFGVTINLKLEKDPLLENFEKINEENLNFTVNFS